MPLLDILIFTAQCANSLVRRCPRANFLQRVALSFLYCKTQKPNGRTVLSSFTGADGMMRSGITMRWKHTGIKMQPLDPLNGDGLIIKNSMTLEKTPDNRRMWP